MQQSKYNYTGFSILELSLVILLIAVIMMLSWTQTTFMQRMLVRNELEQLYATCYYLQRCAMTQRKPQTLTFDLPQKQYRYHGTEHTLPDQVCFGSAPKVNGPPSSPHTVISNPITFPNNTITFHPDGIIQPGAVYLTDKQHRCTYALSCSVAQVSYLRKYQYTNKWVII